jgi:hypothetical protein
MWALLLITLENKFKKNFVSVMNMLLICMFASMKLEKGHRKIYLALVLKLCYHCYILRNRLKYYTEGKKLNTIQWKRMSLVDLLCLGIIFTT